MLAKTYPELHAEQALALVELQLEHPVEQAFFNSQKNTTANVARREIIRAARSLTSDAL